MIQKEYFKECIAILQFFMYRKHNVLITFSSCPILETSMAASIISPMPKEIRLKIWIPLFPYQENTPQHLIGLSRPEIFIKALSMVVTGSQVYMSYLQKYSDDPLIQHYAQHFSNDAELEETFNLIDRCLK